MAYKGKWTSAIAEYGREREEPDLSTYERALKEQGSADVAYARLMLLGSAGTGKTSLKHSLMEEPFDLYTTSTIVSDVSSVRPFGHKWQTMRENKWREATKEDEIEELAHLFESSSSSHHASILSAQYFYDNSTRSIISILDIESSFIQSILRRATHSEPSLTTQPLVQPFLHIWDCGGQPVFLEILPAFLTPRTMFLLLFDASKDFRERWQSFQNTYAGRVLFGEVVNESTSDLMAKWMSTIHSHLMKHNKDDTSSPSLYCIGTRGDKLNDKRKEEIRKQIKSLYEEKEFSVLIKDVLIIDNTTSGKGEKEDPSITKLRGAIHDFIKKLAVKTPVNWVLFRKVFQELKHNIISISDAIAIGVACHIPADDVPEVLKFYHELGAVLYYPQIEGLKNRVILSPKWFVDTIGKVFPLEGCEEGWGGTREWSMFQNKGILVQPLYKEVWRSSGIDPEEIIELLVHFRLAAQVKTDLYDSRFKQYFLPAVLQGYTGDPNEVRPGYKLRASPVHITFSTGYVPPGFFTRLATALATNTNVKLNFNATHYEVERKSIYRNRVCFSYGHPSDDFVLTDINVAIQVDVLRYVPENSHPVPFKTICQQILKLLNECCQKVEDTLILYHGHHIDRSSRRIQYVCQCSPSSEVHYIEDIDAEKQTCSDPVYCKMERIPRSLTDNESLWFKERMEDLSKDKQLQRLQEISPLEEINVYDKPTVQDVKPTTNYSSTQISESNDDQQKDIKDLDIILEELTLPTLTLGCDIKGDGRVKINNNKDKGLTIITLKESEEHGSTSAEKGQSDIDVHKINDEVQETQTDKLLEPTIQKVNSTANYSTTQISESNNDQQQVILTIRNLVEILRVLKDGNFQTAKWIDLGLYLGLFYTDLKTIETNYPRDAEQCLRECLAKWLTDDIEATWDKLAIAAGEVGETPVANYIRSRKELI